MIKENFKIFECLSKLFKQTFFVNFAIIKDEEYTCLKKIFAITEKAWSKEPKTKEFKVT